MIGWDYSVFWEVGRAILEGRSPYAIDYSRYPPAANLLFIIFALLPFAWSFAVWSGANVVLYVLTLRRFGLGRWWWAWLLYTPFIFNLLTGQLDVLFLWAAGFLIMADPGRKWPGVAAGVFLTLKPQLAVVVLPWFLLRWLARDRKKLLAWLSGSVVLHALPLVFSINIYSEWLAALQGVSEMKMGVSGGIFAFGLLGLPGWLLAGLAVLLALWGLTQAETTSRPAQFLASPLTIWYDGILLAGLGPGWWMVGLSWLAFGVSLLLQNSLPLVAIPAGALAWQVWHSRSMQT